MMNQTRNQTHAWLAYPSPRHGLEDVDFFTTSTNDRLLPQTLAAGGDEDAGARAATGEGAGAGRVAAVVEEAEASSPALEDRECAGTSRGDEVADAVLAGGAAAGVCKAVTGVEDKVSRN